MLVSPEQSDREGIFDLRIFCLNMDAVPPEISYVINDFLLAAIFSN